MGYDMKHGEPQIDLRRALRNLRPDNAETRMETLDCVVENEDLQPEDFDLAIDICKAAKRYAYAAWVLEKKGCIEDAVHFYIMETKTRFNPECHNAAIRLATKLGNHSLMMEAYEAASSDWNLLIEDRLEFCKRKAEFVDKIGDEKEVKYAYSAVVDCAVKASDYATAAEFSERLGKSESAMEYYEKAGMVTMIAGTAMEAENVDKAIDIYLSAKWYKRAAELEEARGNKVEAAEYYKDAIKQSQAAKNFDEAVELAGRLRNLRARHQA